MASCPQKPFLSIAAEPQVILVSLEMESGVSTSNPNPLQSINLGWREYFYRVVLL